MNELAMCGGLLFFCLCCVSVVFHSDKSRRLLLIDWAVLGIGGVYGLGFLLVLFVTNEGKNPSWFHFIVPNSGIYIAHPIASFLLFAGLWLGWFSVKSVFRSNNLTIQPYSDNTLSQRFVWRAWFLLVAAVGLQILYTWAYGGIAGVYNYLNYNVAIRSGIFRVSNPWSFLRPFGGLALFTTLFFFGMKLSGYRKKTVTLGFWLSLLFSFYILYSWAGRVGFFVFLFAFPLAVLLYKKINPIALVFSGGLILIALLLSVYQVSNLLHVKGGPDITSFLAKELSFPFASFFENYNSGEAYRFFLDFLFSPVFVLPSSLWSNWVENVGQVNTALIMGAPKGEEGVTGAIPVDLLTLGFMQFHFIGVFIGGIVFGMFLRFIQRFLEKVQNRGIRVAFEAYIILKIAVIGVFYAQPSILVSSNVPLVIAMVFLLFPLRRSGHRYAKAIMQPRNRFNE
jgi:hypothetical protein